MNSLTQWEFPALNAYIHTAERVCLVIWSLFLFFLLLLLFIYLLTYLCHAACRILVPHPGIEHFALEVWKLNHLMATETPLIY